MGIVFPATPHVISKHEKFNPCHDAALRNTAMFLGEHTFARLHKESFNSQHPQF